MIRFFRAIFTQFIGMKFVSLGLALFLWWVVHDEASSEMTLLIKVLTKNVPSHLMISGEVEKDIRLRISGSRTLLQKLHEKPLGPFVVDLADGRVGANAVTAYAEDFPMPQGVHVTQIIPQVIRVNLDTAEERLVRVEPRFSGDLDEGFELVDSSIEPTYVRVKAPRSELEGITALRTDAISLGDRHESFEGVYGVHLPRSQWVLENQMVAVKVKIREHEISKIISNVPVHVAGNGRGVHVEPSRIALKIRGPAGRVSSVLSQQLDVSVNAKVLADRKGQASVKVRPEFSKQPGVEITTIPDNVRVTIE